MSRVGATALASALRSGREPLFGLFADIACRAPAGSQFLTLLNPFVAHGAASKLAKLAVHPFNVGSALLGYLIEMEETCGVEHYFQLGANTSDEF